MNKWDKHFHNLCVELSKQSSCLSRQIGAILVKDNIIISTGYNGPPRGVPHCGMERYEQQGKEYSDLIYSKINKGSQVTRIISEVCPRNILGYASGEGLDLHCPSVHAETNCLASAARVGAVTNNTTMYMNCIIPCKSCFGLLINAGIKEIVIDSIKGYDSLTKDLILPHSDIIIREFEI